MEYRWATSPSAGKALNELLGIQAAPSELLKARYLKGSIACKNKGMIFKLTSAPCQINEVLLLHSMACIRYPCLVEKGSLNRFACGAVWVYRNYMYLLQ